MVPQIARISSGSSEEGPRGAERGGAEEGGRAKCVPSEAGLSSLSFGVVGTRLARREVLEGVKAREEWISPRRFLGGDAAAAAGLLRVSLF